MTEFSADALSGYLSGTLADSEVSIDDIVAHTEGWSRDTVSFTARYREGDDDVSERLVLRAENELQHDIDTTSLPGNDIQTEYETLVASQDASVPVPRVRWFDADGGPFERGLFVMEHLGESRRSRGIREIGRSCTTRGIRRTGPFRTASSTPLRASIRSTGGSSGDR